MGDDGFWRRWVLVLGGGGELVGGGCGWRLMVVDMAAMVDRDYALIPCCLEEREREEKC